MFRPSIDEPPFKRQCLAMKNANRFLPAVTITREVLAPCANPVENDSLLSIAKRTSRVGREGSEYRVDVSPSILHSIGDGRGFGLPVACQQEVRPRKKVPRYLLKGEVHGIVCTVEDEASRKAVQSVLQMYGSSWGHVSGSLTS